VRSRVIETSQAKVELTPRPAEKAQPGGDSVQGTPRGRRRRLAVAAAVLVLTGLNFFMAYWRGTHFFNFSDAGYLLENLHRIRDGEFPYRDFFLSLPPLHHFGCAAVWWLFGDQAYYLVVYAAIEQALVFVLCYLACRQIADRPWVAILAASLVSVGGTAVMGFPVYDTDGGFLFIIIVNLLLWWERRGYHWALGFVIGLLTGLVVLVKLNMGIALLAGVLAGLFATAILRHWHDKLDPRQSLGRRFRKLLRMPFPLGMVGSVVAGTVCCLGAFVGWLAWHGALEGFIEQNIVFPYRVRLHAGETLIETYGLWRSFRVYDGWVHYDCWRVLVVAGTAVCLAGCWRHPGQRPLRLLILIPTIAFALGTFQSQGYGSTYGIYEVAAILLFELYVWLEPYGSRVAAGAVLAIAAAFLITGTVDLLQGTRLRFLRRPLDDPAPFHLAKLRGLSGTREYRDSFEQLAATVQEVIPPEERFFYYPGDLPLYYVTGRGFPMRNFLVQRTAGWTPEEAEAAILVAGVPWLILRTEPDHSSFVPQAANDPGLVPWALESYDVVKELDHFLILKHKKDKRG
jgi:hypothetical protein